MLKTLAVTYSWANHLTQSLFYTEVFNVSYNLLTTVLKVRNRLYGHRVVARRLLVDPHGLVAASVLGLLPSHTGEDLTAYCQPRKISKLKLKVWFLLNTYHFHFIVKLKNSKSRTSCPAREGGAPLFHRSHASQWRWESRLVTCVLRQNSWGGVGHLLITWQG